MNKLYLSRLILMCLVLIVRYRKTFPWSVATTFIKKVYFLSSDPAEVGEFVGPHGTVIDNMYTMFQQQMGDAQWAEQ